MIPKYVSHHSVAVTNTRVGNFPPCNLLKTPFICCCIIIFRDMIVSQYQGGGIIAFGGRQTSIHMVSYGSLLKKNSDHGFPL